MEYFSMFSGIGGFELGIQNAYRKANRGSQKDTQASNETREGLESSTSEELRAKGGQPSQCLNDNREGCQQATCVGFSEIDKYAVQCYSRHFPDHKNYGDATKLIPEQLPDFQLLVGGFPCQAFSIAGKRKGFNDTRGTLFFEIARVLQIKRPQHFLLENVKGLLSHDSGKTFSTILGVLTDLGYRVEWQILNSKYHGVPQNRERVFLIGHLRGECSGKVFPIRESNTDADESGNESEPGLFANGFDSNYYKGAEGKRQMINIPISQRINKVDKEATTLNSGGGGQGANTGLYQINSRIRRLTPMEAERLQGFPDGWTEGLSDTQRYKCLGNAVTVNVIKDIFLKILEHD